MPSDDRLQLALTALEAPLRAFTSSLEATADEIRSHLGNRQSTWEMRVARVRAELGPLAEGRVDAERFAELFDSQEATDPIAIAVMKQALETLTALAAQGEQLCLVDVQPGGSLYEAVLRALGEIGRAFGAARVVHAVRAGGAKPGAADAPPETLPFARWTRNERRFAPPLVVRVQGGDLRAAALAEFLDGRQRIVLLVDGECAPTPLVRLAAPGTFVLQTADGTGLDRLLGWDGPGIAALVPGGAARFAHDPAGGAAAWQRVTIEFIPDKVPRKTIGGLSPAQQLEELELLRSLAARPAGAAAAAAEPLASAVTGAPASEPADKLAAWILSRVDLSDLR